MGKKITSHDVAKRAGVSRVTVSMVLNRARGSSFSEATRKRVFEAAEHLGYQPNAAARTLVSGTTETVGVVVRHPELLCYDGFVPQILQAITRVNQSRGYRVLLEMVHDDANPYLYVNLVRSRQIDGLLVIDPPTDDRQLRKLIEDDFPLVLFGTVRHPKEHSISISTDAAMQLEVDHLIGLGHSRIGHITYSPPGYAGTDQRLESLRAALGHRGLPLDEHSIAYGAFSAESGFGAVKKLLGDGAARPTAIVVGNDTIALGVIAGLIDAGLRVPEDIAVVGFDNLPVAAYIQPPLTTIDNPAVLEGTLAAEMLIALLRGEQVENPRVTVPISLVIRKSCGGGDADDARLAAWHDLQDAGR